MAIRWNIYELKAMLCNSRRLTIFFSVGQLPKLTSYVENTVTRFHSLEADLLKTLQWNTWNFSFRRPTVILRGRGQSQNKSSVVFNGYPRQQCPTEEESKTWGFKTDAISFTLPKHNGGHFFVPYFDVGNSSTLGTDTPGKYPYVEVDGQ